MRTWRLPERTVTPPPPAGDLLGAFLAAIAVFFVVIVTGSAFWGFALSPLTWYVARASGIVLFVITWLMMVSGLGMTTRLLPRSLGRSLVLSVHAWTFHLWYGFLLLHVVSIALDPTVDYGARELLVPFTDTTGEPWVGLGIVAAQLLLVVGGSALLRQVFGFAIWRALHYLAVPGFVAGLAHGIGAGSDSGHPLVRMLYLAAGASVLFLGIYRVLRRDARDQAREARLPPVRVADIARARPDNWHMRP